MFTITLQEYTDDSFIPPFACFLQSRFWAEFKHLHGWTYRQYEVHASEKRIFILTVLLRPLSPFGLFAYIPMGPAVLTDCESLDPECAHQRGLFLTELAERLTVLLPPEVFLIRFDPPWGCTIKNDKVSGDCKQQFPLIPYSDAKNMFPVLKSDADIQPPDTVQLDLSKPLETLLNDCKPKWRYNIRLAEKKGVCIRRFSGTDAAEKGIPIFYALYRETAVRDGIAIHSEDYYRSLCLIAVDHTKNTEEMHISVYAAFFEEKPLAAIITLFSPFEAVYLYGASSNEHRNLMPAYLLQWKAISDAQNHGCRSYDFYGIPPSDNPSHPMHGLYRFKTGFGGSIIHRVGTLDVPVKIRRYRMYIGAEWLRTFWFKTVKKKLRTYFVHTKNRKNDNH